MCYVRPRCRYLFTICTQIFLDIYNSYVAIIDVIENIGTYFFLFVRKSCLCLECFSTQVRNRYKGSICAKCKGKVYFRRLKTKYKSGIRWQRYGIVTVSYIVMLKNRVAYTLMYSIKDTLGSIYIIYIYI